MKDSVEVEIVRMTRVRRKKRGSSLVVDDFLVNRLATSIPFSQMWPLKFLGHLIDNQIAAGERLIRRPAIVLAPDSEIWM